MSVSFNSSLPPLKQHDPPEVNILFAAAAQSIPFGLDRANQFLASFGIPEINHNTWDNMRTLMTTIIDNIWITEREANLQIEVEKMVEKEEVIIYDNKKHILLFVSFDMIWATLLLGLAYILVVTQSFLCLSF